MSHDGDTRSASDERFVHELRDESVQHDDGERDLAPDPDAEADLLDAAPGSEPDPPPRPAPAPRPPTPRPAPVQAPRPTGGPRYEPRTGAEPEPAPCQACGARNTPTARVCGRCGADVGSPIPDARAALAGTQGVGSPYLQRAPAPAEPAPVEDPADALPPEVRARVLAERARRAALKLRLGARYVKAVTRFAAILAVFAALLGAVASFLVVDGGVGFFVCLGVDAALGAACALALIRGSEWKNLSGSLIGGAAGFLSCLVKAIAIVAAGGGLLSLLVFLVFLAVFGISAYAGSLLSMAIEGGALDDGLLEKLA